ncbi:MAG: hypothetical protein M3Q58_04560 [Bacteroidota bacterium]|nr:hypothetical protein [Bacteroidota bacterium]
MNIFKITAIALMALFLTNTANAQSDDEESTPWIFGIGTSFIDNDGKAGVLFDFKQGWNTVYYPSRLSAEKIIANGFSAEAVASYNRFRPGKIFNGKILNEVRSYVGVDVMGKYDLNEAVGQTIWFDPFVMAGLGYTYVQNGKSILYPEFKQRDLNTGNFNVGFGFNLWITDEIGLNLQTVGKFTFDNTTASNYLQHSVAVVYKMDFDNSFYKAKTRKGITNIVDHIQKIANKVPDSTID